MEEEASDPEETPCSSSGTDGEGVGATQGYHFLDHPVDITTCRPTLIGSQSL